MADDDGPFPPSLWAGCVDETLPPDHIKLLTGEEAVVFRLYTDPGGEKAMPVASWPEKAKPPQPR